MVRLAREILRRLDSPPVPAEPAAPPAGGGSGKVAYITEGVLATIQSDGAGWTCIATRNPVSVAFSPDGKQFAFTSAKACPAAGLCKDRSEIYFARIDGSEMTPLASPWAHDPAWSPDGSRILFAVSRLKQYTTDTEEVFLNVVPAGGADPKELAPLGSVNFGWSPDGKTAAFTCREEKQTDVCTIRADGSGLTNLTQDRAGDTFLQWSPDGKRILFSSDREQGRVSLFLIDSGGGVPQALVPKGEKVPFGAWSPLGDRIAYVYNYHTDIFTVLPDGGGDVQLTDLTAADICPAWSPDGKKIAFITQRNKAREVFLMNADGTDPKFLAAMGGLEDYCPVWVPG
jgi:Tol biopolymer transport system component